MECPSCQTGNPAGQKFCGTCGHKLEVTCIRCQKTNPPHYKYCGHCGAGMSEVGAMTLARSGLITEVNQKALDMLGCRIKEMKGKPFSLFVERSDLVIFFSRLNEMLSTAKKQSFEIKLKHKDLESIYVLLECSVDSADTKSIASIQVFLTETTDTRLIAAQMQTKQELLGLIFTVANNISTVSRRHLEHSVKDALKKICLFTKADVCFIYGINRPLKRLDPVYEWRQTSSAPSKDKVKLKSIPLSKTRQTIIRLRQEKMVVVHDIGNLEPSERDELLAWHKVEIGAVIIYLIYSGKIPVGVIGVANVTTKTEWAQDCMALIKFFGDFIADRLSTSANHAVTAEPETPPKRSRAKASQKVIDIWGNRPASGEKTGKIPSEPDRLARKNDNQIFPDMGRPMLLEKAENGKVEEQLSVLMRDDGLVLLTCPGCGALESVSSREFDRLGNTIQVGCPCGRQFNIVLEKRRYYRKSVRLEGYFSLGGELGPIGASGKIWGPMIVKDLSKAGLRFVSKKAHLIHKGDLLMVRFNLDNTNQALIHKPARVISISDDGVGCRFEGADSYDITLGFYFM